MPSGSGRSERAVAVEEEPEPFGSRIPAGRVIERAAARAARPSMIPAFWGM